jgi:hypothetical protein
VHHLLHNNVCNGAQVTCDQVPSQENHSLALLVIPHSNPESPYIIGMLAFNHPRDTRPETPEDGRPSTLVQMLRFSYFPGLP